MKMTAEESPQRANLEELVSEAGIPAGQYWENVERINTTRIKEIGSVAIFGDKVPKDPEGTIYRVRNTLRRNGASIKAGAPQNLVTMTKSTARKKAQGAYFKLGVLSHLQPRGEYVTTLLPALENSRAHSLDHERAAHFLTNTDHEKKIDGMDYGNNQLTRRNILTAMLNEAGLYFLDSSAQHADTSSGEAILKVSQNLLDVVTLEDLDSNPEATSMLLRRGYTGRFYNLYREAKAPDKPHPTADSYRQALASNIDTYLSWAEHKKSQSGLAFEWVVEIDFREFILFHEMYDIAYVKSPSPGEDYPIHNMRGGPLDNKQSIDLTVVTNDYPHFLQCKINGAGNLKHRAINGKNTPAGYDKHSGWYAKPIKMLYATDMFQGSRARGEDRDEYLMNEFSEHVKAIKERVLNPYDTPQVSEHDALLTRVISN